MHKEAMFQVAASNLERNTNCVELSRSTPNWIESCICGDHIADCLRITQTIYKNKNGEGLEQSLVKIHTKSKVLIRSGTQFVWSSPEGENVESKRCAMVISICNLLKLK